MVTESAGWRGSITLRVAASGLAPVEVAWERYENLDLWTEWSPQLRRVEAATRRLRPGLAGRVVGPAGAAAGFVVTGMDAQARRWEWTVRRWPIVLDFAHGIDRQESARVRGPGVASPARGAARSRAWLVVRGPAPVVLGYAPLAWYALTRLVRTPGEPAGR